LKDQSHTDAARHFHSRERERVYERYECVHNFINLWNIGKQSIYDINVDWLLAYQCFICLWSYA